MEDKKIDSKTIEVQKVTVKNIRYDIDFLYDQKKAIQAQKERDNMQRDNEIDEIDDLISRSKALGIDVKE